MPIRRTAQILSGFRVLNRNLFLFLFSGFLGLLFVVKTHFKKTQSWQDYLHPICQRLYIPLVAARIQNMLFRNPYLAEPAVSQVLMKTTGDLFVDVGAQSGRYSILLSEQYTHIIAVEPHPKMVQFLRFNTIQAGLTNIQVLQCAVSNHDGFATFHISPVSGWSSLLEVAVRGPTRRIQVKTLTLSSILKGQQADLIKVDTEGAEWLILEGAEPVMNHIKRWVIEVHELDKHPELKALAEERLQSYGYSVKWLDSQRIYAWRAKHL